MKIISFGLSICLILSASGCGWLGIRDRSNDYNLANETEPTVIPEQMNPASLGQLYPIPSIATDNISDNSSEVPRPQPISVNTFEQLVKMQRIDDQRWILVNSSPSELWPRIRNVLNRSGIPSARAEGSAGIIESIWLSYKSDEDNQHRFRFVIAPGVQVNSTEISVIHQQKNTADKDTSDWPDQSHNGSKEQDMLSFIANELALEPNYASVSLLAQKIGGDNKVEVINPEVADPFIRVKLTFDRSWASVNYSVSRGGFTLIDQDLDQGLLLVNYTDQLDEQDQGFFDRWFGQSTDNEILEVNYRILVKQVGDNIEVRLVSSEGESLDRGVSLKLLNILRGNMS